MSKQFCKKFSKKSLDDEKDYLCLKLKKITRKELRVLREYLNQKLEEFSFEEEESEVV